MQKLIGKHGSANLRQTPPDLAPAVITRFAPSPTGPLHLGHAYSAFLAYDMAQAAGGQFLLRIEDIDLSRARAEWEDQIYTDLSWLGIRWSDTVMRQSDRAATYAEYLQGLWHKSLIYPCSCTRRDIQAAVDAPQEVTTPLSGPDGLIYPGTCRPKANSAAQGAIPKDAALRLDMRNTLQAIENESTISFIETGSGTDRLVSFDLQDTLETVGDIVLARRDMGTSYHLSVVLDDAAQGITHVVRGQDLFEATKIHVILQQLLGLPTPTYHHHRLIRDDTGKRLAKRDDARAISKYRADGYTPSDIRALVGL